MSAGARAPMPQDPGAPIRGEGTAPLPLAVQLGIPDTVRKRFRKPPRAGLLFDLDTGRVLWRRAPQRQLPIASLTKLMTALLVDETLRPGDKVPVTRRALHYQGSGIGLLKRGRSVRTETMLAALLLFSANDAAIALAERVDGGLPAFVTHMNARARTLGLRCTRFASPDGLSAANRSCPADLAALARAAMRVPRIARWARTRRAVLPFPIKGGSLIVYSHNPLLRLRYPGTTGLKTGYTDAAGPCFIGTAKRGKVRLGVVLLHSPNPGRQAASLLDAGFRANP